MPVVESGVTRGLSPVSGRGITRLVLGSLPSRLSVERQEYYGNPQNAFWRIVGTATGVAASQPYAERVDALVAAGVGLWDVLESSVRPGSLDADIDESTAVPNRLGEFLDANAGIRRIGFNGRKARHLFDRRVHETIAGRLVDIELVDLPSTSPAHAAMPFDEKLARWTDFLATGPSPRDDQRHTASKTE